MRYYTSEVPFYQDAAGNPHGPVELNTCLLDRLPRDGTIYDISGAAVSTGGPVPCEAEESGLFSHVEVESDDPAADLTA